MILNQANDAHGAAHARKKSSHLPTLAAAGAVILSVVIALPVLSPILYTAATAPFLHKAMRQHAHRRSLGLLLRWCLTIFVTLVVCGAFVPQRVENSILFSRIVEDTARDWLLGGQPLADYPIILWGTAATMGLSLLSGGILGVLVLAAGLGAAAAGTLFFFSHAVNAIQIAFVALPLWQVAGLLSGAFAIVPLAMPVFERISHIERVAEGREVLRLMLIVAGGLFITSILLRVALAGLWGRLLHDWTVF